MALADIKQVVMLGAGNMGTGIADVLSRVGSYNVTLVDTTEELVQRGLKIERDNLQKRFVDRERMTAEEMEAVLSRIKGSTNLAEAVSKADLIIEAVFENMDLKKSVFKQIDEAAPPNAIIASNTSYLSVTEMAGVTNRPENIGGMHFFNPPGVMKLVEIVRAALTSEETATTLFELAEKLEKEPVYCRDTYGFLANRAVMGQNEAAELVWAHVAPPEDIDRAVKLGYNWPMGPIELYDMIGGWRFMVDGEDDRIKELGWDKGHVHTLIKMMYRAGYSGGIGRKGMYDFWKDVLSKW